VRITDPGGNYDWRDSSPFHWGDHTMPMSHAFGGITGPVKLVATDPVYVDDIYVQNSPAITNVNIFATIKNVSGKKISRDITFRIFWTENINPAFVTGLKTVELNPGDNVVTQTVSLATVKLWDLEHPNLYICDVSLDQNQVQLDNSEQTFGFRWFGPEGIGSNAMFRLNGKRIVVRTSISWGFWPINGIFPTPELAEKQVRDAKDFGLNMLNFHRAIGQPNVLDKADELGLLYYEEPGAYKSAGGDFSEALMREKVLRMVKRDRSHPSLAMYSMINERNQRQPFQDRERADMLAMHEADPSRTITLSSSWATLVNKPEDIKAHMRPFDGEIHFTGWFDNHHAGGPEVWRQNLYQSPTKFYNCTTNRYEIVYWGEEGAISSPPRLEKIKAALDASPVKGWDGRIYLDWYRQFNDFLTRKKLRGAFPTVEAFTTSMGAVSLYHQGRKIETLRICDAADGYAVNGWEAESVENHSGIVDCWRNPKADPAIMAYYNQPLYVAVKTRSQFAQIPGEVAVDFYGINEKNLSGAHTLKISAKNPAGKEVFAKEMPVTLTGGDVYGEMLAADVKIPIADATGIFRVEAGLRDAAGKEVATGHDEILAVDWKSQQLGGTGATWESTPNVRNFLAKEKSLNAEEYRDDLGKLDWVVVTRPPGEAEPVEIPAERFDGGLTATFFSDDYFRDKIHTRTDRAVDYFVPDGAVPDPKANVMENYSVRWEGKIIPAVTGNYTFATDSTDGVKLWVDDKLLFDDLRTRNSNINRGRISLEAGKAVTIRLDLWHRKGDARCKLQWSPPEAGAPDSQKLIERVRNDGTTLLILDRADTWMRLITNNTAAKFGGSFIIGTAWLGGLHFVREHPLFADLPVNTAMSWPYQAVVRNGRTRSGLLLEGDDLVAGAWHCYPMNLGTAVGIIPCGKGRIIVNTLDITSQLNSPDTSAEVARKLLCNFITYSHPAK
jgi:beta-galactosidase